MAKRVPCKNPDCSHTILEATAKQNDGLCMPCVQAQAKKERDEFVKKNRREVNEFEGITDAVEILKIIHRPRKHDPLVNWIPYPRPTDEIYLGLSEKEIGRLENYAIELIRAERGEEAEDIIRCLSAFTKVGLDDCLRQLVAHKSYYPNFVFHRSPVDVRDELFRRVETDEENRNLILIALAWIGDDAVVEKFANWRQKPPAWSSSLYKLPHEYSREAGWELTEEGHRRDLFFKTCYHLGKGSSSDPETFQAISDRMDSSPWCSVRLIDLLNLEPQAFGLMSPDIWQGHLSVTTCQVCSAFGTVYGEVDEFGKGHWSPLNIKPEYFPDDAETWERLPENSLMVGQARPPLFAADEFLPTSFSQLGGHPTWIQDAEYPICPKSSKTMMFLAQIWCEEIQDHSEGAFYIFVCPESRMTATIYQQT